MATYREFSIVSAEDQPLDVSEYIGSALETLQVGVPFCVIPAFDDLITFYQVNQISPSVSRESRRCFSFATKWPEKYKGDRIIKM